VQLSAILTLAQIGDDRATMPVIAWLTRKLKRSNRRFLHRSRSLCVTSAFKGSVSYWSLTCPGSIPRNGRLPLVWPDLESRGVGTDPSPPDPVGLDKWLNESGTRPEDYAASDRFMDTYVQAALARAHRRARRVEGS